MNDTLLKAPCHRINSLNSVDIRRLNKLAKDALTTPNADVILSLGKSALYNRKVKKTPTVITWLGDRKKVARMRLIRPEFEHTLPQKKVYSLDEGYEAYRQKFRQSCEQWSKAKKTPEKFRFGTSFIFPEKYIERCKTQKRLGKLKRIANYPAYPYMIRKARELCDSDRKRNNRHKKMAAKISQVPLTFEIVRYQRWYIWLSHEKLTLPLRAEYYNERLIFWREYFRSHPEIKTYKTRKLSPYTDTFGFTYYRNIRDKFVPPEAYTYGINPKYRL